MCWVKLKLSPSWVCVWMGLNQWAVLLTCKVRLHNWHGPAYIQVLTLQMWGAEIPSWSMHKALIDCMLFLSSRARGFLWIHHCVVDGSDVELWSVYVWGEGTVGPSNREPDLCQLAVMWEHKEQGTVCHELNRTGRLSSHQNIVIVIIIILQLSPLICILLFPSFQPLSRPHPPLCSHFKLSHVGGCQTGAPQCGGSLIRSDRHQSSNTTCASILGETHPNFHIHIFSASVFSRDFEERFFSLSLSLPLLVVDNLSPAVTVCFLLEVISSCWFILTFISHSLG